MDSVTSIYIRRSTFVNKLYGHKGFCPDPDLLDHADVVSSKPELSASKITSKSKTLFLQAVAPIDFGSIIKLWPPSIRGLSHPG